MWFYEIKEFPKSLEIINIFQFIIYFKILALK